MARTPVLKNRTRYHEGLAQKSDLKRNVPFGKKKKTRRTGVRTVIQISVLYLQTDRFDRPVLTNGKHPLEHYDT